MRRHSFHSIQQAPRLHKTLSHSSNVIDSTYAISDLNTIPEIRQRPLNSRYWNGSQSPRSSAESVMWSENTSDSESISTPPSELQDQVDVTDPKSRALQAKGSDPAPAIVQRSPRRRRASTNLIATSSEDIQRILGDGTTGTKFLQKYCCGEGCCMLQKIPVDTSRPGFEKVPVPDNHAFRSLALKLDGLALDTPLTGIIDVPASHVSLEPVPRLEPTDYTSQGGVHPPAFVKPHPPYEVFSAPLYSARQLTQPGAEKRTYHFDLDITDYPDEGGVDFKVGGAIGVCPPNDAEVVEDIFNCLGVPKSLRDRPIKLKTDGGRWPTIWGEEQAREIVTTRRDLLTWCTDITSTPPTKPLFRLFAEHTTADNEKKILLFLASAQGQAAFCDIRTGPFITLSQLLHAFPSAKPPLDSLFSILPQLMPRFYSLSNDPFESSAREGIAGRKLIEMAVTVHETPNWDGSPRTGVGSGFLERTATRYISATNDLSETRQAPEIRVPIFRGLMANPLSKEFASEGPMMLVGAGVGMAPFRGFILNRLRNANCANKIWLVQGVRDSLLDEIYAGELGTHEKQIKKVVQSRVKAPPVSESEEGVIDDEHNGHHNAKIVDGKKAAKAAKYVQDEVRLQADIVWFVINAIDGRIFVCGSTKGMGEGVEQALVDVAMEKGNLNLEEAKRFWESKKECGQYVAETW